MEYHIVYAKFDGYFDKITTDNVMGYTFDGANKANYSSVSSPLSNNLTWETVTTYNWGLDLSFLDSRLNATIDIFRRDTKDMLTHSLTLPSVYGATTHAESTFRCRSKHLQI